MRPERFFEDPQKLHVGTMPPRSYYIPSVKGDRTYDGQKALSPRVQMLNGEWEFAYYADYTLLEENFPDVETISLPDRIPVPSVWQLHGYGQCQYVNALYPIPYAVSYTHLTLPTIRLV